MATRSATTPSVTPIYPTGAADGWQTQTRKAYRRSVLGGLVRQYGVNHPKVAEARRDLEFVNLADHIAAVVAGWPPLSEDQLDHIAGLLRPGRSS